MHVFFRVNDCRCVCIPCMQLSGVTVGKQGLDMREKKSWEKDTAKTTLAKEGR